MLIYLYAHAYSLEERMDFTSTIECIHLALHKSFSVFWVEGMSSTFGQQIPTRNIRLCIFYYFQTRRRRNCTILYAKIELIKDINELHYMEEVL